MSEVETGIIVWVHTYEIPTSDEESEEEPVLLSKRLAYITGGTYYGSNGGICNFWDWTYFNEDGTLSEETESGYDNGSPFQLVPSTEHTLEIRAIPNPV